MGAVSDTSLVFRKVGADPEALFYSRSEKIIVPAYQLCGGSSAYNSWIGTDGHSITAELRPKPNRNVLMVLADLANALGIVKQTLDNLNQRSQLDLVMVAQPIFRSEYLGGHVHLSYWYPPTLHDSNLGHRFASVYEYIRMFLVPLHNQFDLDRSDFSWRLQPSPKGRSPRMGFKGARIEFRKPGTWLRSPALAYAYLGLSKLAILNFPELPKTETRQAYVNSLQTMKKTTSDLRTLPSVVDHVLRNFALGDEEYPTLVDFAAWKKVIE